MTCACGCGGTLPPDRGRNKPRYLRGHYEASQAGKAAAVRGGKASADTRLVQGREAVLACRTKRELLEAVNALEKLAYMRGWQAGRRKKAQVEAHDWLGV